MLTGRLLHDFRGIEPIRVAPAHESVERRRSAGSRGEGEVVTRTRSALYGYALIAMSAKPAGTPERSAEVRARCRDVSRRR